MTSTSTKNSPHRYRQLHKHLHTLQAPATTTSSLPLHQKTLTNHPTTNDPWNASSRSRGQNSAVAIPAWSLLASTTTPTPAPLPPPLPDLNQSRSHPNLTISNRPRQAPALTYGGEFIAV
ncbi:hypothetical protein M758_11G152500 [Ceratodon purpureus]|nr:hypothetical protein M758_11G152500 [Ceratodon purpureus]